MGERHNGRINSGIKNSRNKNPKHILKSDRVSEDIISNIKARSESRQVAKLKKIERETRIKIEDPMLNL